MRIIDKHQDHPFETVAYTRAVNFFRHRLQLVLRIALIAMFGLALVPTLSRAMNPSAGTGPWSEICSAAGERLIAPTDTAPAGSGDAPASPGAAHMAHCPLCAQFSSAMGLPPSDPAPLPLFDGADHLPALCTQSLRPLFAWAPVQARAPPLLCAS